MVPGLSQASLQGCGANTSWAGGLEVHSLRGPELQTLVTRSHLWEIKGTGSRATARKDSPNWLNRGPGLTGPPLARSAVSANEQGSLTEGQGSDCKVMGGTVQLQASRRDSPQVSPAPGTPLGPHASGAFSVPFPLQGGSLTGDPGVLGLELLASEC